MTDKTKFTYKKRIWEDFGNAVIAQAAYDYRTTRDKKEKEKIIKFFKSKWFGILTNLDPDFLINHLKEVYGV